MTRKWVEVLNGSVIRAVIFAVVIVPVCYQLFIHSGFYCDPRREIVSRAKSDLRSLATAIESYCTDHLQYPLNANALTTPIAYVSSLYLDACIKESGTPYRYWSVPKAGDNPHEPAGGWIAWSAGLDGDYDITYENVQSLYSPQVKVPSDTLFEKKYDPSNGIISDGDIWRTKQ